MENENTTELKNIKTHSGEETLRLPEEIIEDILSRLPVKSLLKFRCVSKSWRSLIGSKGFIITHLQNSAKNTNFAHHKIVLNSKEPHDGLKQCPLPLLLNQPFTDPFAFDDSIAISWDSICLVGCCNGLVCILLDRKHFVLWNPSRRMSKKLPDIDDKIKHGHITKYGFGCDESSGDCKVFGVMSVFFSTGGYEAIGKIYSLKTSSWKITKGRDVSPFDEAGKFASGKLHWQRFFGFNWDIVSFDLKSEVYGIVEQPCYSEGGFYQSLGVLGKCLCVLCDYQEAHLDVWVMKQYGVKESWDKVVSVPDLHVPPRGHFLTPFCIGPNGEILLIYGSTFIIYSPKDNGFRHHWIIDFDSFREVGIYTESLVSLVPDSEQEGQTSEPVA